MQGERGTYRCERRASESGRIYNFLNRNFRVADFSPKPACTITADSRITSSLVGARISAWPGAPVAAWASASEVGAPPAQHFTLALGTGCPESVTSKLRRNVAPLLSRSKLTSVIASP